MLVLAGVLAGCDWKDRAGPPEVERSFGRTGEGPGEFVYPRAVALAPDGTVAVVDKTGRVQRFTAGGKFLHEFRMPDIQKGKPTGLSFAPDGTLYVADTHYNRVLAYGPDGALIRQIGRYGTEDGCFIYPTDVAFAGGRIYVSEYGGNDRISVFDGQGKFCFSFGRPGSGAGEFSRPAAMCVDERRARLYVADACNHRIAVYDLDGRPTACFGTEGAGPGQLRYPYGLSLKADGSLAVCEYGNNRVQVFRPDGRSLAVFGGPGRQLGELAYPWALAVDAAGRAYVVDAGNNRIQVWRL